MIITNYSKKYGKWLLTLAMLKACWLRGETTMYICANYENVRWW